MTEFEITYDQLGITPTEIYEQMGYGDAMPDDDVLDELRAVTEHVRGFLRPRFSFFMAKGELNTTDDVLSVGAISMNIGRIISRQLRNSELFAFFVATSGMEFEHYQQEIMAQGDMVKVFIADALGSVIAEKTADVMEQELQKRIDEYGWLHTNRFSPGYCGWHVSEQQKLFPMFRKEKPCGITLTDSSLMLPIKSVSGVIGLGQKVRKLEYTCGLCNYEKCYKRRKKNQ